MWTRLDEDAVWKALCKNPFFLQQDWGFKMHRFKTHAEQPAPRSYWCHPGWRAARRRRKKEHTRRGLLSMSCWSQRPPCSLWSPISRNKAERHYSVNRAHHSSASARPKSFQTSGGGRRRQTADLDIGTKVRTRISSWTLSKDRSIRRTKAAARADVSSWKRPAAADRV